MANSNIKWASVRILRERSKTVMNELLPTVAIKAAKTRRTRRTTNIQTPLKMRGWDEFAHHFLPSIPLPRPPAYPLYSPQRLCRHGRVSYSRYDSNYFLAHSARFHRIDPVFTLMLHSLDFSSYHRELESCQGKYTRSIQKQEFKKLNKWNSQVHHSKKIYNSIRNRASEREKEGTKTWAIVIIIRIILFGTALVFFILQSLRRKFTWNEKWNNHSDCY